MTAALQRSILGGASWSDNRDMIFQQGIFSLPCPLLQCIVECCCSMLLQHCCNQCMLQSKHCLNQSLLLQQCYKKSLQCFVACFRSNVLESVVVDKCLFVEIKIYSFFSLRLDKNHSMTSLRKNERLVTYLNFTIDYGFKPIIFIKRVESAWHGITHALNHSMKLLPRF